MSDYFFFKERNYGKVNNDNYYLHTHNEYEIYMFIEGNSNFIVENKIYELEPGDIIITRKNEMHRVHHKEECEYKSLVIMVAPAYFKKYGCEEYEKAFTNSFLDKENKISVDMAEKTGILDAVSRLRKYSEACTKPDAPVIISTITEILYLINEISNFKPSAIVPTLIKKIMNYISLNIENDISLDDLADEFFVSKYHLCFKFKKFTGLTIGEYITQKRLALADNYIKNGETLSSAASKAGFSSYSAFYKAYKKNHNSSPRTSKKI